MRIREAFEQRVQEQESASLRLNVELDSLRIKCADVTTVREALEAKLVDQENMVANLERQLSVWQGRCILPPNHDADALFHAQAPCLASPPPGVSDCHIPGAGSDVSRASS